uniref:Uncharacterized protein n=1 Tax=Avena sativa TaxID=4498 RepID=A0ACD5YWL5_AVESA
MNTQFYRECRISGTVDFIFGDATAVFQKCTIVARKPIKGQKNTITAHKRKEAGEATGYVFQFCDVVAADELARADFPVETYLGRPWDVCARVVFMDCHLQGLVDPKGWLQWQGSKTDVVDMFYAEYHNSGAGADVSARVKWPAFHAITDASQAANFTVHNFISGDKWLPATGVDFTPGLH